MKAIAVIGANFGDEGKGRLVDHFAASAEAPAIVVRYNGGAQAGHTVVTPDGKRHVFHHFGSGTLAGASTFLSHWFIANPMLFCKELDELLKITPGVSVFVSGIMPLSTPYDMILNREIEAHRGNKRHGSCGMGISETIERLCSDGPKLFMADTLNGRNFKTSLLNIKNNWVPKRLREFNIKPSEEFMTAWQSKDIYDGYLADLERMSKAVEIGRTDILKRFKTVIFEGAQGLGLDERHRFFPHVTRSKTGIDNIQEICKFAGISDIHVCYVTRAYLTRHGAGPLPTESDKISYADETNCENLWQGKLRFGHLDLDLLTENIRIDQSRTQIKATHSIAVTCLDQVEDRVVFRKNNLLVGVHKKALPGIIGLSTGIKKVIASESNTRKKG